MDWFGDMDSSFSFLKKKKKKKKNMENIFDSRFEGIQLEWIWGYNSSD